MTEVATVSIVAKNKYSARAGVRAPTKGGTNVRPPFIRVKKPPVIQFVSRLSRNGMKWKRSRRFFAGAASLPASASTALRGRAGGWLAEVLAKNSSNLS